MQISSPQPSSRRVRSPSSAPQSRCFNSALFSCSASRGRVTMGYPIFFHKDGWVLPYFSIPSGKLTVCYWKRPIRPIEIVDLASYKMVIFHGYVNLPDGKDGWTQMFLGNPATHRPFYFFQPFVDPSWRSHILTVRNQVVRKTSTQLSPDGFPALDGRHSVHLDPCCSPATVMVAWSSCDSFKAVWTWQHLFGTDGKPLKFIWYRNT